MARKRKISKRAMITAVVICIIIIVFIIIDTIRELRPKEEMPNEKAEFANQEIKTEEDIYEKHKITLKSKTYDENGIIQVEISFPKQLFENDISNKEFFEQVIKEYVKIYKKDFILIDTDKNIKIEIEATSENNYVYKINGKEDYYEKAEEINENIIKEYKEIEEKNTEIQNKELNKFDSNEWSVKAAGVEIKEYGNDYLGYDGYKVLTDDIYIDTIILEKTYTQEVLEGIKVGTSKEEIIEKLGKPTFEENYYIGYKTFDSYIFFYEDEIAIYPNTNFTNTKLEKNIVEFMNAEEKEERKLFANKILTNNMDFKSFIDEKNNLHLKSVNRGIEIIISENLEVSTIIYNNYDMTSLTKELIREERLKTKFDKDLIFENEKERK